MQLGISVVICTYNGARLLPKTLQHLARQQVRPDINWEILVVDNASTDNTQVVLYDVWSDCQSSVPLTVLYQARPGLTYARDMALKNAAYEFILFCDDDNWLSPAYINTAYDLMCQHPEIGLLGGNGQLVLENAAPLWARGHGMFASGPQAPASGKVPNNIVYGAGSVIRRRAFEKVQKADYKPLLTDRLGAKLSAGGDYELCYNLAMAGYDIWYEERLTFRHFMPTARLQWSYLLRLIQEGAGSFEVIVPYRIFVNKGSRNIVTFYFWLVIIAFSYSLKWARALVNRFIYRSNKEVATFYQLKTISAKAKLSALLPHGSLLQNFLKVKALYQQLSQQSGVSRKAKASVPLSFPNSKVLHSS